MSKSLLEAAKEDSISKVQSLVDSSDLSMKDDDGNNVLHLLLAREHPIFIRGFWFNDSYIVSHILAKEGVDKAKLMEPNKEGLTPLDILLKSKCRDERRFAEIDHTAKLDLIATIVEHGAYRSTNTAEGEIDPLSLKYLKFINKETTENDVDFVRYQNAEEKYYNRGGLKLIIGVVTTTLSVSLILLAGAFTVGALWFVIPAVIVGCERFSNACAEFLTKMKPEEAYAHEAKIRADKTFEVLKGKGVELGKASVNVVDEKPELGRNLEARTTDLHQGKPTSDVNSGAASANTTADMYKMLLR